MRLIFVEVIMSDRHMSDRQHIHFWNFFSKLKILG